MVPIHLLPTRRPSTDLLNHPPDSSASRRERAAGEVRQDSQRDSAAAAGPAGKRGEPNAGRQDREAALGRQRAAEPDVGHRARRAGDDGGEGQSEGHRPQSAAILPLVQASAGPRGQEVHLKIYIYSRRRKKF